MNVSDLKKIKFFPLLGLIIILLNFSSCKKDPEQITLKQISDSKINYIPSDSTTILAYSAIDDSVKTTSLSYYLLGSINDPIFGKTTAGIYSQFTFDTTTISFGSSPVCDSLVLTLAYTGAYYGDTNSLQNVKVFELDDTISNSNSIPYYATSSIPARTLLGSKIFKGRTHKNIIIGTDTLHPNLRIKLDLNNQCIQHLLSADSASLASPENFIKYFKGLYITTDPLDHGGAIYYLNLAKTLTSLTLYYHNSSTQNIARNFVVNSYCRSFTHFNHYNYSQAVALLTQNFTTKNYHNGDSTLFLQSMSGVRIKLKIPYINSYSSKGNIFVNRAELIIPVDTIEASYKKFSPPGNIYLWTVDSRGIMLQLKDFSNINYLEQAYDTIRKAYVCDISEYFQKRINNKSILDDGLFVVVADRAATSNRAIINGPKRYKNRMKLNLTYIKINNSKK